MIGLSRRHFFHSAPGYRYTIIDFSFAPRAAACPQPRSHLHRPSFSHPAWSGWQRSGRQAATAAWLSTRRLSQWSGLIFGSRPQVSADDLDRSWRFDGGCHVRSCAPNKTGGQRLLGNPSAHSLLSLPHLASQIERWRPVPLAEGMAAPP